ncbi:hypothetical protein BH20VER1_BH20VER1_13660 [soil metagenome]
MPSTKPPRCWNSTKPARSTRLALCELTANALQRRLDLLGIKVPERCSRNPFTFPEQMQPVSCLELLRQKEIASQDHLR